MNMSKVSLNDLFDYEYKIYQNDEYFKFSIDSVLLAEAVCVRKNQKELIDLCSGNAPVLMILNKKFGNKLNLTGVELQSEIYNLGIDSINYNKITNINYINEDVNNIPILFKNKKFDIVTCNPPYFKYSDNLNVNDNKIKAIARHEIKVDLEQIINICSKIIKNGGYFYLVHRTERLADIINLLNKYRFGVKNIKIVYDNKNSKSCIILVESIYNGENYVTIDEPLYLREHDTYQNIFGK